MLIEIHGVEAGLVVRDERGQFRFFAAAREAFRFEGRLFRSAADARRAVAEAIDPKPSRRGG
ncbi:hypothetical protein ACFOWB_05960 [Chenggangzhangella methanolivorans]|uniref:hypothetical protein n=1 Tax=Chenggangzhangella methanolivorans TaxID=1437009 RepID=UPI00361399A0